MRVYPGPASEKPIDAIKVRSSFVITNDDLPRKRRMILKDLDQYFTREGYHTIEIVQESPHGTSLLCRNEIKVDRTISVNGGVMLREEGHGDPYTPVGSLTVRQPIVRGGREWEFGRERYGKLEDSLWQTPWQAPLSTFSVDVDTASYSNIRRMLKDGTSVPKDAVRLEECVNYFDYGYAAPKNGGPFAVHVEIANCPWEVSHHLVKIGIKGREVIDQSRPPSNLVFLIDVSGSMNSPDKLPLLAECMKVLVGKLDQRDSVGIVVYAGSAGTVLEPTEVAGRGRAAIVAALDRLRAGGSTAGAAGIRGAYELAARNYRVDGVNRVILATDGDFNVGTSNEADLVSLVKEQAGRGTYLSVLGFGRGNLNDSMMEAITNEGNGNYFYLDSQREGRKVFLQNLTGTLVTIAKDVKIQVEFNPGKVQSYRLLGYANRRLQDEDFDNDKVDAGDIGAGHTVTALYEVVPLSADAPQGTAARELKYQQPANRKATISPEWLTVKLRYKAPAGEKSELLEVPLEADPRSLESASPDLLFASAVALFAEKLRGSEQTAGVSWHRIGELALSGSPRDSHGHRAEFLELLGLAAKLSADRVAVEENLPAPVTGQSGAVEAQPVRE